MSDYESLMKIEDVCEYLRIHKITAYRLVKAKKLPVIRVGGQWRFKREDIERLFELSK
ncbi:helix-turn-helix domain-containing protein [Patescibacteria group bacterium]|nr:helix-turn-helix domain-containing protein [Patescibacteria group bacterium]